MINYKNLPKIRDSLSYMYIEHAIVEKDHNALKLIVADGTVQVPIASISVLLLGPGTSITHDAVRIAAENGCSLVWTGEEGVRTYASGTGETRKATRLLKQVNLWANEKTRLQTVVSMYKKRFSEPLPDKMSIQQLRGHEGVRVREAYSLMSKEYKVEWTGRSYDRNAWNNSAPINRALSTANSCLYGVVHAAIVAVGYSPALGFIHTGKQLSFVYDIADLYKVELTLPAAFSSVSESEENLEKRVRQKLRDYLKESKFMIRIVQDIDSLFEIEESSQNEYDDDPSKPGELWTPAEELEKVVLCL